MVFFNSRRCLAVFSWAKPYPSVLLLTTEAPSACHSHHKWPVWESILWWLVPPSVLPLLMVLFLTACRLLRAATAQESGQLRKRMVFNPIWGNLPLLLCFEIISVSRTGMTAAWEGIAGATWSSNSRTERASRRFHLCCLLQCVCCLLIWIFDLLHTEDKTFISSFVLSIFIFLQSMHDIPYQFCGIPCCWLIFIAINVSCLPWGRISRLFITLWFGFHLPSKPEQLLASTAFFLFCGIVVPLHRQ